MTDDVARLCINSNFEPKLKDGDKIIVIMDSVLMNWDDFEDIYEGDKEE